MQKVSIRSVSPIKAGSETSQRAVCKVLEHIRTQWGMNYSEFARLLRVHATTYGRWVEEKAVPVTDSLGDTGSEIIFSVIDIYKSIAAMFSETKDQLIWMNAQHPDFNHRSALSLMLGEAKELFHVQAYLNYIRGIGA